MILLSTLIDTFGAVLRQKFDNQLLPGHLHALSAMAMCRTDESLMMKVQCNDCGKVETIPHSCGHRNCPHCQHHEGQLWLERQRAKLLPVDYYMITFTLPRQFRKMVWLNQRIGYNLLLKLGWQTLKQFGLNDSQLKGNMGAHAVLHTHSRQLDFHPHVHFIVPAGAIDLKHRLWRKKGGKYLFHHENLAKVFRGKWYQAMKQEDLSVSATAPKKWVVDCKHVGRGDKALTYLGKYLYRGVLQERDILSCEEGQVTFRYTDNTGSVKTRILPGADFLWLLLQHVLPKGFRRTRDFGFLHSNCKAMIQLLQYLFRMVIPSPQEKRQKPTIQCKACGGYMIIIATRLLPKMKALLPT